VSNRTNVQPLVKNGGNQIHALDPQILHVGGDASHGSLRVAAPITGETATLTAASRMMLLMKTIEFGSHRRKRKWSRTGRLHLLWTDDKHPRALYCRRSQQVGESSLDLNTRSTSGNGISEIEKNTTKH